MLKFILPLLAALNCVQISDNEWRCSSDGSISPDYPVEPDPSNPGSYTCTNCTGISQSECEAIKSSLQSRVSLLFGEMASATTLLSEAESRLLSFKSQLEEFYICPYTYCEDSADLASQPGYDPSITETNLRNVDLWNKIVSYWHDTPNYSFLRIEPVDPSSYKAPGMTRSINYLVGVWECSYAVAQQTISSLSDVDDYLSSSFSSMHEIQESSLPSLTNQIASVTCAPCTLSASSSGGSGGSDDSGNTGTQMGCLSCYTQYLESMDQSLDWINNYVDQINTKLSTFIDDVTDSIKDNLDIPLSSISNVVGRIDDYIRVDLDSSLDAIKSAVIVISNEVSDIQNHFYMSFKRADQSKNLDDEQFSLVDAIDEIPQGGDSVWSRLNWFSRIEALLGSIAGFGTNTADVASEVSSEVLEEYDQNMSSVRSDSSGLAAREQISSAMDTVSSVLDSFRIFDSVHEPEAIRLLDASDVPFLSGGDGAQLTIEMPNVPAIYSFLRFVRYAFIALYWSASLLSFFYALLGLYSGVVSLAKWASQFLGSVFSS